MGKTYPKSHDGRNVFGLISRIDYLSEGFRKGLIEAAFTLCLWERVSGIILGGGLISYPNYCKERDRRIAQALLEQKILKMRESELPKSEKRPLETSEEIRRRVQEEFMDEIVRNLNKAIPTLPHEKGDVIKIYIVTSPASNYDGPIGKEVANRLDNIRSDIMVWDEKSARFPLSTRKKKFPEKDFWWVLPDPTKGAWRSRYYSTRPDRLVEDKARPTSQELPNLWISDCACVSLMRPQGELDRPQIAVSGLHRLQETITAENQIGLTIVEFSDTNELAKRRTYSLKDLTAQEKLLTPDPKEATKMQLAVLSQIRKAPQTIGMLEDRLPWERARIQNALAEYQTRNLEPWIFFDESVKKYELDLRWLQEKLHYPLPPPATWKCDSLLGFGCLHVGYLTTQYEYFKKRVPELILENDVTILVGAGDYIAGMKHNLHLRKELYGGLNYTEQEKAAAELVGKVIVNTFHARFEKKAKELRLPVLSTKRLARLVDESLLFFYYWEGNHDKWLKDQGVDPLASFDPYLKDAILEGVETYFRNIRLSSRDYADIGLRDIIRRHVVFSETHILPSGLRLGINHPEMARMGTTSGRAQQTLAFRKDCQIVYLANFHVAIAVEEWNNALGQRLAMQCGTLIHGTTEFEGGKLKICDTGVALSKVYSVNQRIFMVESFFDVPKPEDIKIIPKDEVFNTFIQRFID